MTWRGIHSQADHSTLKPLPHHSSPPTPRPGAYGWFSESEVASSHWRRKVGNCVHPTPGCHHSPGVGLSHDRRALWSTIAFSQGERGCRTAGRKAWKSLSLSGSEQPGPPSYIPGNQPCAHPGALSWCSSASSAGASPATPSQSSNLLI